MTVKIMSEEPLYVLSLHLVQKRLVRSLSLTNKSDTKRYLIRTESI